LISRKTRMFHFSGHDRGSSSGQDEFQPRSGPREASLSLRQSARVVLQGKGGETMKIAPSQIEDLAKTGYV
jgi:hypothetical protein